MPIFNAWLFRELAQRLRQPGMRPQRRFIAAVGLLMALFFVGAAVYLFRQPTEDAMERAALRVFAVLGVLIGAVIAAAVVFRKRMRARWVPGEVIQPDGEKRERGRQ
jgi:cbb3-type cytochrome oxidase subunit 3